MAPLDRALALPERQHAAVGVFAFGAALATLGGVRVTSVSRTSGGS